MAFDISEETVAALKSLQDMIKIPEYKYVVDPCPTCGSQVTTVNSNMGGFTAAPCGHPITCQMNQEYVNPMLIVVTVKLQPAFPPIYPYYYLAQPPQPSYSYYDNGSWNVLPETYWQPMKTWGDKIKSQPAYAAGYAAYNGGSSIVGALLKICPGLGTVVRKCPECKDMGGMARLSDLIPHVNDSHKWSREKIASWLEIIADDPDVDLTIKPISKEIKSEQPSIGPSKKQKQVFAGYGEWSKWVESEYPF